VAEAVGVAVVVLAEVGSAVSVVVAGLAVAVRDAAGKERK
jgi:hypothetical protein